MVVLLLAASAGAYEVYLNNLPVKQQTIGVPSDQSILVKLHQFNLWVIPTAKGLEKSTGMMVGEAADKTVLEHQMLDAAIIGAGVTLPNRTTSALAGLPLTDEKGTVNAIRQQQGELLKTVIADRVVTQNPQMRDIDNQATLALERGMAYMEATGLVDYALLNPASQRVTVGFSTATVIAGCVSLVIIAVLSVVFIRLLLRRGRRAARPVKGSTWIGHSRPSRSY